MLKKLMLVMALENILVNLLQGLVEHRRENVRVNEFELLDRWLLFFERFVLVFHRIFCLLKELLPVSFFLFKFELMRGHKVIQKLQLNHVFFCDDSVVLFLGRGTARILLLLLLLLINVFWFGLILTQLDISVLDTDKQLCDLLVLLPWVVLAHNELRKTCEGEVITVHDALLLDELNELIEDLLNISMRNVRFVNESLDLRWLDFKRVFGQTDEEIIQILLVLVLPPQVVLELCVGLNAFMNDTLIVGEHCQKVVHHLIQSLHVSIKLFLPSFPNSIPRFPHLQFGRKVSKLLIDELNVANA